MVEQDSSLREENMETLAECFFVIITSVLLMAIGWHKVVSSVIRDLVKSLK